MPEPRTFTVTYIDSVTGDVIKVDTPVPEQEYVAIYDTYYPEAITVARTIHYRYLTQDGEEVVEDHIDSITFTRRAIVDGEQTVYSDGTNEELWVIYQPQKGTEEKEITRVVYYTYYTEDGDEASVPVKQTAKLARDWTIDPETGERVYGDWYIVEEPTAADVPEIPGFKPNKTEIPAWEIDLNDPKDGEDVHVVYDKVETPDTYWVTYVDPDGKTIYLEKTTVNKGEDEPEKPEDPKKDGFVFGGWDRSVDEDGNVTYTAIWTPVPTDPTELTQPTEPTDPTEPTEPTDPTKPTDPTEPTTVTTSVDGKTVVDPTTATQPYVIRDASTGQTIAVVTPAEQ